MKILGLLLLFLASVVTTFAQIEVGVKYPFFNSGGAMLTSDPLLPGAGPRSKLDALAYLDYGSISISIDKSTIYALSAAHNFAMASKGMHNFISRKFGHTKNLNLYIDETYREFIHLTLERFKLTKNSKEKLKKRNSRRIFTGVYNGISLGFSNMDFWDEQAYYHGEDYLKSYQISSVIPFNIELGVSRYYLVRTNAQRFNVGADFKVFGSLQLPNITRLEVRKFNSAINETNISHHLVMPMIKVGIEISSPFFSFTLKK